MELSNWPQGFGEGGQGLTSKGGWGDLILLHLSVGALASKPQALDN